MWALLAMEDRSKKPSDHLYWARTASTTQPVEHKPLDAAAQAALQSAAAKPGAAWNAAATWEEKDISKWAHELLSSTLLPTLAAAEAELTASEAAALPADSRGASGLRCALKVSAVSSVSGDVTHVLSRGKQRVVFELTLKLKLELELRESDGTLLQLVAGSLSLSEVANDDLDGARMPSSHKTSCDQPEWAPLLRAAAGRAWPPLKGALVALVEQAKEKWR